MELAFKNCWLAGGRCFMANNASAVYMADQFFPYLTREAVDEQDMRNLAAACELMAKRALEAADKLEASVEVDVEALRTAAHEGPPLSGAP